MAGSGLTKSKGGGVQKGGPVARISSQSIPKVTGGRAAGSRMVSGITSPGQRARGVRPMRMITPIEGRMSLGKTKTIRTQGQVVSSAAKKLVESYQPGEAMRKKYTTMANNLRKKYKIK